MEATSLRQPVLAGMLALLRWFPPETPAEGNPSAPLAKLDARGQVVLSENGQPVLRYNARRVELPEGYFEKVAEGHRIYAKPRSGYLHPLYGLDGEELTQDWSIDHPHHRGIYWAWPEVRFGERSGDLHALQRLYSRPVGEPRLTSTGSFARVDAVIIATPPHWHCLQAVGAAAAGQAHLSAEAHDALSGRVDCRAQGGSQTRRGVPGRYADPSAVQLPPCR